MLCYDLQNIVTLLVPMTNVVNVRRIYAQKDRWGRKPTDDEVAFARIYKAKELDKKVEMESKVFNSPYISLHCPFSMVCDGVETNFCWFPVGEEIQPS